MSGIFWEPSQQPDLMESVSVFGSSCLNLAMALPMFVLDLVCTIITFIAGMINMGLAPVLELMGQMGQLALSSTGLEDTLDKKNTLFLCLGIYALIATYWVSGKSYQRFFSRTISTLNGIFLVTNFLLFPAYPTALYSQAGILSLGFLLAAECLRGLFREKSGFNHDGSSIDSTTDGYLNIISMDAMGAMIVCAWGYPGSSNDEVTSYYCLVPLIALQLIYFTSVFTKNDVPEVAVNGHITELKEQLTEKIMEVKEVCGEKVAEVKEKIEAAVEKAVTENPEVLEAAAKVEAAGEIVEEKIEEVVEAVKEKVEIIGEIVEEKVEEVKEKIETVKADPFFQRVLAMLTSAYTWITTHLCTLLSPVCNMISNLTSKFSTIPWTSILFILTTYSSHIIHGLAWHQLTSSYLSAALPLLTLALPLTLDTLAPKLPSSIIPYIQESGRLAVAGVIYLLITGSGETA